MRRDILHSISEEKDITNAIVLTHNIDFVFIQTLVLSALRRCGYPSLTILADASCAAASYAYQAPVLHGLGVRYRVVPVALKPGFRFHPKAMLLSGPDSAKLYVGSGNLTFGGWRENAEIWLSYDSRDGTMPFSAFLSYLTELVELVALPDAVRAEIQEAFDPETHVWAADLEKPGGLLGKAGKGPALLDQMLAYLTHGAPDKVTVCAPYFDEEAEALTAIGRRSGAGAVVVLTQPNRTGLTEAAWKGAGSPQLTPITFQHADDQGRLREAFLHAKFYAFERAGHVTIFAGSANCSRAALTIPGAAGNAELMAVTEMSENEFRLSFLDELSAKEGPPGLAIKTPEPEPPPVSGLRILGASYEDAYLRVAYAPSRWSITACMVDGAATHFEPLGAGVIGAQLEVSPRQVFLEGTDGASAAKSAEGWIDHESALRSTARGRSVAEAIQSRVRAGEWSVGAWSEVFNVFCAHLRYLPPRLAATRSGLLGSKNGRHEPIKYSFKDVFASAYGLPSISSYLPPLPGGAEGRVRSLQQLLLRWFGLPVVDSGDDVDGATPIEPNVGTDVVDRPVGLPTSILKKASKPEEGDLRRVKRLVAQMTDAMASAKFQRERPPELLSADLKVASALLRVALREGWLDPDTFFQITHDIWVPLFFDAEGEGRGWLQRRYESAPSADDFAAVMRSPDLLAALVAWVSEVRDEERTPAHARFSLAAALAVARLPWLWDGVDDELVSRELADLLAHTNSAGSSVDYDETGASWLRLVQRGHALRRMEQALAGSTPVQLAPRIHQKQLSKGELLWQGTSGFGVVTQAGQRIAGARISVLPLRGEKATSKVDEAQTQRTDGPKRKGGKSKARATITQFAADLTVPMAGLLDHTVVPLSEGFRERPRDVLRGFVAELAEGFASAE